VADAAGGTGTSAPAVLDAAVAHAATWSMTRLADRYVAIYDAAVSQRRRSG